MKKFTLWLFVMFSMTLTLKAQENKFYGRLDVGAGLGLCYYDDCFYDEDYYYGTPPSDLVTSVKLGYGGGLAVNIGAGYRIKNYLSVELAVNYFNGFNVKQTYSTEGGESGNQSNSNKRHAMMLQIIPSIVLSPGLENINPYMRVGLIVGAWSQVREKETSSNSSQTIDATGKYHGGVPIGYSVGVGIDFKVGKNIDLYAEVDANGINYTPKKYDMLTYNVNGVDQMGSLTTKQKKTVFEKKYDRLESIPDDSPNKALRFSVPLSNAQLNIGIKYNF